LFATGPSSPSIFHLQIFTFSPTSPCADAHIISLRRASQRERVSPPWPRKALQKPCENKHMLQLDQNGVIDVIDVID
jgi:hypothetical protein